jgi:hypothetical protein
MKLERQSNRRRQSTPRPERDYSVEEVEFMNAMDEYKRKSGRMFPTCSEVLEVIRSLGYVGSHRRFDDAVDEFGGMMMASVEIEKKTLSWRATGNSRRWLRDRYSTGGSALSLHDCIVQTGTEILAAIVCDARRKRRG